MIDTRSLEKGESTEKLPEVYVVFITENDVLGEGKAVYRIERYIDGHRLFDDGAHIVYVNGAYRGADKIGDLMHDFACQSGAQMHSPLLRDRVDYLKGKRQEVEKMSPLMERLVKNRDMETAAILLEEKRIKKDELAHFFGFTEAEIEEVVAMAQAENTPVVI